jgi:hypothetical protein
MRHALLRALPLDSRRPRARRPGVVARPCIRACCCWRCCRSSPCCACQHWWLLLRRRRRQLLLLLALLLLVLRLHLLLLPHVMAARRLRRLPAPLPCILHELVLQRPAGQVADRSTQLSE